MGSVKEDMIRSDETLADQLGITPEELEQLEVWPVKGPNLATSLATL